MYFLQIGTGGLADRIGRRPPVIAGMFIAGAGVLGMVFVDSYLPWTVLPRCLRARDGVVVSEPDDRPQRRGPIRRGGRPAWASTGCGATPATALARS